MGNLAVAKAQEQITQTLLSCQGVSAHPHRSGGTEYRLGQRELAQYARRAKDLNPGE
jgi:hypothetical protein